MTEEREELPEETAQSQLEPAPAEQDEETWLHIILGIPYIGEFLTAVIGVFPMILIFAASEMLFGVEPEAETRNEISTAEFWTVRCGILDRPCRYPCSICVAALPGEEAETGDLPAASHCVHSAEVAFDSFWSFLDLSVRGWRYALICQLEPRCSVKASQHSM